MLNDFSKQSRQGHEMAKGKESAQKGRQSKWPRRRNELRAGARKNRKKRYTSYFNFSPTSIWPNYTCVTDHNLFDGVIEQAKHKKDGFINKPSFFMLLSNRKSI